MLWLRQSSCERTQEASMIDIEHDVLFSGLGTSAVCYYRAMLPAMQLETDWTGVVGDPPNLLYLTGLVHGEEGRWESKLPNYEEYKVVVLQQPNSLPWFAEIDRLQKKGVKVLFEVDDYLHAIRKVEGHDFAKHFHKDMLARAEVMMKMCDGIICSTPFIAKRYRKFGPTFVCRNGLDLARYDLTRPKRQTINIGWAGATGHREGMQKWIRAVYQVMTENDNICFISVGRPFAKGMMSEHFGEDRCLSIPFAAIEQYPAAMTMFDIALAPAGKGGFFRGKSDLRWMEAGALAIPTIADPMVYNRIEHGVNGFHADTPAEALEVLRRLAADAELRTIVGNSAQEFIRQNCSIETTAQQWADVFEQVTTAEV
jgi:glycosyltransferase involved in cell wall biosynthesis